MQQFYFLNFKLFGFVVLALLCADRQIDMRTSRWTDRHADELMDAKTHGRAD